MSSESEKHPDRRVAQTAVQPLGLLCTVNPLITAADAVWSFSHRWTISGPASDSKQGAGAALQRDAIWRMQLQRDKRKRYDTRFTESHV